MHCSCLSWGLGEGGGVSLVQRHMQRGLGLNTIATLGQLLARPGFSSHVSSRLKSLQALIIVTHTAADKRKLNQLISAAVVVGWNEKL